MFYLTENSALLCFAYSDSANQAGKDLDCRGSEGPSRFHQRHAAQSREGFMPAKGEKTTMITNYKYTVRHMVHFIVDAIWSNSRAIKELGHEVRILLHRRHQQRANEKKERKVLGTHSSLARSPRSLHSLPAITHSPHSM